MTASALSVQVGLEARCDNWGEAVRGRLVGMPSELVATTVTTGDGKQAKRLDRRYAAPVRSLERGFVSPQRNHWQLPGLTRVPTDLDLEDAQRLELAVSSVDMYHHAVLRGWHVYRLAEPVVLRLAAKAADCDRSKLRAWPATIRMAYALLAGALELPAVIHRDRARARVLAIFEGDS